MHQYFIISIEDTVENSKPVPRKQQKKTLILNTALNLFAEVGFDAASFGAIAKRCDVKKSLVQYHFETKDNLWKSCIDHLWTQLREAFPAEKPIPATADDEEIIRKILKRLIRFARDNPAWVGIVFREASIPGPRLDWLIDNYLKKDFDDGAQFITLAQKNGWLPKAPPVYMLHIISGSLTYALFVAPLTERVTGIDMTSEDSLNTLVDTLLLMLGKSSQQNEQTATGSGDNGDNEDTQAQAV